MKTKDIIDRVKKGIEGVEFLNGMQEAMASAPEAHVMLIAPTGSGKTIAFAIRMLRNLDVTVNGLKGVVIAPTRELVLQITEVIRNIGLAGNDTSGKSGPPDKQPEKDTPGLRVVALYGGHKMEDEKNSLEVTPDIVVATPGRLVDHITRGTIDISGARSLVLDEFDKSLQLGFQEQMRKIVKRMRRLTLVVLTSATTLYELPEFVGNMADFKLYDYSERESDPTERMEEIEVISPDKDKLPTLVELLRGMEGDRVIIFVNYRDSAERVYERLVREGFSAGLYHGALDQQQRRIALEKLANGTTPILVATDLASRGLDIPAIEAVVHYHDPIDEETRKHRNGRTARQGATGKIYTIVVDSNSRNEDNGQTVASGARSTENVTHKADARPKESQITTLYINAGKREKISKGDVAGYVMKQGGLERAEVGRIMVDDHYALVAVPAAKARVLTKTLSAVKLKGQRVKVSII